jgi:N-acetylneuraminic acid mutarotase
VLPDGGVLVVGGGRGARARTAELRKPEATWEARETETQGWSIAGSLADNRWSHTASLLPDGRVLVVGGIGDGDHGLASAEIWTPGSRAWRRTGRLHEARWNHAAVVLHDGRVLVVGGWRNSSTQGAEGLDSAEVWDPTTQRWSMTGALPDAVAQLTVSLLPDGRVLAAGGKGDAGNPPGATGSGIRRMAGGRRTAPPLCGATITPRPCSPMGGSLPLAGLP